MNQKRKLSLQKEARIRFKQWLEQAQNDFSVAKITFKSQAYDWVTFSCQQTLEKLFKGIYLLQKVKFPPHTHDLVRLHQKIIPQLEFPDTQKFLKNLTKCYIASRYPEFRLEQKEFEYLFTKEYASQLFNFTKQTLQWYIQKFNCKNC